MAEGNPLLQDEMEDLDTVLTSSSAFAKQEKKAEETIPLSSGIEDESTEVPVATDPELKPGMLPRDLSFEGDHPGKRRIPGGLVILLLALAGRIGLIWALGSSTNGNEEGTPTSALLSTTGFETPDPPVEPVAPASAPAGPALDSHPDDSPRSATETGAPKSAEPSAVVEPETGKSVEPTDAPPTAARPVRPANPRKKPRPKRARRVAEIQNGTVVLSSDPWAYVEIEGKRLQEPTPIAGLKLKAGEYRIRLFNPAAKLSRTIRVQILPNQVTRRVVRF